MSYLISPVQFQESFNKSTLFPVVQTSNLTIAGSTVNAFYTNTGASGLVNFTLSTPTVGNQYTFIVTSPQTLQITATGSAVIGHGTGLSSVAGSIYSSSIYTSITLKALSSTLWVSIAFTGDWTLL